MNDMLLQIIRIINIITKHGQPDRSAAHRAGQHFELFGEFHTGSLKHNFATGIVLRTSSIPAFRTLAKVPDAA